MNQTSNCINYLDPTKMDTTVKHVGLATQNSTVGLFNKALLTALAVYHRIIHDKIVVLVKTGKQGS
jgi:hypothetical protein